MKKYKNEIIGLLVFAFYIVYSKYSSYLLVFFNYDKLPTILKLTILITLDLLLIIILSFVYLKTIAKDFKDFKTNFKKYIDDYAKYWFLSKLLIKLMLNHYFLNTQYIQ